MEFLFVGNAITKLLKIGFASTPRWLVAPHFPNGKLDKQKWFFYAEVIAGNTMPNLMYMTTFENEASRDEHWDVFGQGPQWKALTEIPEYQHNLSKNVTLFFRPASYSDF